MAIREVFSGGELESVRVTSGAAAATTTTTYFDSTYSACAIDLLNRTYESNFYGENGAVTTVPLGETLWCHVHLYSNGGASVATISDDTGRPILRTSKAGAILNLQRNSGTTASPVWVTLSSYTMNTGRADVDFYFKTGSNKECGLYVGGSLVSSSSFSDSSVTAISTITLGPGASATENFVSQLLVTENKPTVGAKVWTRKASAAGAVSGMTGVYTSLVKTSLNDSTAIVSSAAAQISTFAYQDVTTPSGMVWGEVWVWSRAKNDGSAPTGLNGIARIGSTNYSSPLMQGMGGGFNGLPVRWKNNPATLTKWTDATFNAAEIGMESVT